jgi:hypothetical protein
MWYISQSVFVTLVDIVSRANEYAGGWMQNKVRNAVIIIVLCLIGGYQVYKPAPAARPSLGLPPADALHDALSGNPINASNPLHLSNSGDEQLRDSVAGNAIPGVGRNGPPHGNTEDQTPPPPRGGDHNGIGPLSGPNPGSQLPPPGPLSPSGPTAPTPPQNLE